MTVDGARYGACTRYLARVVAEPPLDARDFELRRERAPRARLRRTRRAGRSSASTSRSSGCARSSARRGSPLRAGAASRSCARRARCSISSRAASRGATSALGRLRDFGAAVVAGEGYRRLVALLEHEENQSALDLHVRIGADGEVRSMKIVGIRENRDNPFYASVLRRLVVRLILFFRGYRTTSGEVAERVLSDVLSAVEDEVGICFQLLGRPRGPPRGPGVPGSRDGRRRCR